MMRALKIWILKARFEGNTKKLALFNAIAFFIAMEVAFGILPIVLHTFSFDSYVTGTLVSVVTTFVFYLFSIGMMKKPLAAMLSKQDEYLGRSVTPEEWLALHEWYKTERKPSEDSLQPVLPKYLSYMEARLNGSYTNAYVGSKSYRTPMMIISCFIFLVGLAGVFTNPQKFVPVTQILSGGLLFASLMFSSSLGQPNRFSLFVNRKRLEKIERLRSQL